MDVRTIILALIATLLEGMAYSWVVFQKSVKNEGDSWNPSKAGRTITIAFGMGLLAALIAAVTGWPMEDVTAWGTATGLFAWFTILIDQGYSYATGPKGKADREKLKKELEEDVEKIVPVIEKAAESPRGSPDVAKDEKVDSKDDKVVPKGKDKT